LEYVPTWLKTAQMAGVLFGAVVSGQLGNTLPPPLYHPTM